MKKKNSDDDEESVVISGYCDSCGQPLNESNKINDIKYECIWCGWEGIPTY